MFQLSTKLISVTYYHSCNEHSSTATRAYEAVRSRFAWFTKWERRPSCQVTNPHACGIVPALRCEKVVAALPAKSSKDGRLIAPGNRSRTRVPGEGSRPINLGKTHPTRAPHTVRLPPGSETRAEPVQSSRRPTSTAARLASSGLYNPLISWKYSVHTAQLTRHSLHRVVRAGI